MQPKKTKFAKFQKVTVSGVAQKCNEVAYGSYGLVAGANIKLSGKELEAMRKVVSRTMNRNGALYMRVFPHLPIQKSPLELVWEVERVAWNTGLHLLKKEQLLWRLIMLAKK